MKVVILAGGGGKRLWPVSRKKQPKQVQAFIGRQTLLQLTYKRLKKGFKGSDIYISTNYKQVRLIKKQLPLFPDKNLIVEPAKKDTAAAIGLAAITLAKQDPKEVMIMANSDGYIKNEKEYIRILKLSEKVIKKNPQNSLLIGIRPTYPETGYGYIKINKIFKQVGNDEIFYGQKFIEKPDLTTAKKYIKTWDYLWNPAMFCWRVDYLLSLYKKHLPQHYSTLMKISEVIGTRTSKSAINREFNKLKPISIDYGIMEKTKNLIVIPASFDWADVGHWRTVKEILASKESSNVTKGRTLQINSKDNLIYSHSGKLIATAGLEHMIVIETEDCILVCPKDKAQDVKKIVEELEKRKLNKYL
ncbi:mannose-1-phosphate guanylyltransferase [Patescibacteria group bacterium]|nr:mannose-1-phosphate guanylyltransferase [Patescibacteria group bacterium]MBU0963766.1 mannose-1-phosphate guanylyltransferase [Patescibacteria group bacterium]